MVLFQCILSLIPTIFISWLICMCVFKKPKQAGTPPTRANKTNGNQPSSGAPSNSSKQPSSAPGGSGGGTATNEKNQKKVEFMSDKDPKGDSLYDVKTDMAFPKKAA